MIDRIARTITKPNKNFFVFVIYPITGISRSYIFVPMPMSPVFCGVHAMFSSAEMTATIRIIIARAICLRLNLTYATIDMNFDIYV